MDFIFHLLELISRLYGEDSRTALSTWNIEEYYFFVGHMLVTVEANIIAVH
jgi:hypothetical protein